MNYFTSDTHFGHHNIIEYCKRPFSSVEEMNEVMREKWNEVVKPNDTVYHLGDVAWFRKRDYDETIEFLNTLNGKVQLILGNHDNERFLKDWKNLEAVRVDHRCLFKMVTGLFTGEKIYIHMYHYPIEAWDRYSHKALHLHGHVHGRLDELQPFGRYDVGVDSNDYRPISFEEIYDRIMRQL